MQVDQFWDHINIVRAAAGADLDERIKKLRERLQDLPAEELQSFQNHYDAQLRQAYRWDLWGAAYIMLGGCSDDSFRYFRDWLISEGVGTFEKALENPDSLADVEYIDMPDLETFGYITLEIYEQKAIKELNRDFSTEGAEPAGERWEEDNLMTLFPRLSAKY
ncbi:MAG: DUF4240 domain-containing protein [Hyphomicrobiales bacterium]|nr:DUF4240 domain-containing protein [Hyphomicrobiales bacterium]